MFVELLRQAGAITGRLEHDHHSSRPVADDDMAKYDPYHALVSAVRRSAEMLVADDPARMRNVIGIVTGDPANLLLRLAMHVLARNPAAAPDLAERYLLDPELIGRTWAQHEYAALGRAWFPSLSPEQQRAVLAVVHAMPNNYREVWRERFRQQKGSAPTADDEHVSEELTIRDAQWEWRTVLPPKRREALERIAAEHGDPDAWRRALDFAPMHSFDSPTAGTGKSMVTDIVSIIATGEQAGVVAHTEDQKEFDKHLSAILMRGIPLIAIDNCEAPLKSTLLNQTLTQPITDSRISARANRSRCGRTRPFRPTATISSLRVMQRGDQYMAVWMPGRSDLRCITAGESRITKCAVTSGGTCSGTAP
jgi:hypothetical protein